MTDTFDDAAKDLNDYDVKCVAMGWYTPKSWRQMKAVAADKHDLADSFKDFVRNANERTRQLEARGFKVEKFYIDVDHLAAWCKQQGYRVDASSRAAYGTLLAMHDGEVFDIKTPIKDLPGRMQ